jgi:hypothetical protein
MRWIEQPMSPYLWPRAPLKRDQGSHVVAQRHSFGYISPCARYDDSLHIHPFHPCEEGKSESS